MTIYHKHAIILLATGFDATSMAYTLDQLRQANFYVQLVGLQKGLVQSLHGLWVKPDASLETADLTYPPDVLIMPDGEACATTLLRDPRVHRLLQQIVDNQGVVAALPDSEVCLQRTAVLHYIPDHQLVRKMPSNGQGYALAAFTQQVVARLAA